MIADPTIEYAEAIQLFGNDLCFANMCGSIVYGSDNLKNDLDLIVVLNSSTPNNGLLETRKRFSLEYYSIHRKLGRTPDRKFPGEVISLAMAYESAVGRGTSIIDGRPALPMVKNDNFWNDPNNEYRCWRSMLAFHAGAFIGGNKRVWKYISDLARAEIFAQLSFEHSVPIEEPCEIAKAIMHLGKEYIGITLTYDPEFTKHLILEHPTTIDQIRNLPGAQGKTLEEQIITSRQALVFANQGKTFKSEPLFRWEDIR